jgi:SAM-dependent methyltransferase
MARMLFQERQRAESFGAVADLYDRVRPSYPSALVDALVRERPRRVLDIGCGTGIAGALLDARNCEVLGVEVDERMARIARARGLRVEISSFERWDARGRTFELAISAQAWHWIDPVAGAQKAAAALQEGARIGVFWNFGHPPPEITDLFAPIYARVAPGVEGYSVLLGNNDARAEATVAGLAECKRFTPAEVSKFRWSRSQATADWLQNLQTHSDHLALPARQRERLLAAIGEAVDSLGGSFEMSYEAVLVSARRH